MSKSKVRFQCVPCANRLACYQTRRYGENDVVKLGGDEGVVLVYCNVGRASCAAARYVPSGENAQPWPPGRADKAGNLVNVSSSRLYTVMKGEPLCAAARYVPSGENAQPCRAGQSR